MCLYTKNKLFYTLSERSGLRAQGLQLPDTREDAEWLVEQSHKCPES